MINYLFSIADKFGVYKIPLNHSGKLKYYFITYIHYIGYILGYTRIGGSN